jgi:hypothetical protein
MIPSTFYSLKGEEITAAIKPKEYLRLLGLPRSHTLEGAMLERAQTARSWYTRYGKPFAASRRIDLQKIDSPKVELSSGHELNSAALAYRLNNGDAHALMIIAASAGPEVSKEVARLWAEGKPDEAFFLDRLAVAVAEHLIFHAAGELCRASEPANETLMPHLSPGCGNWDLADQHKLMELLTGSNSGELGPLKILSSGAIEPQHSVLAVMGVTHKNFSLTPEQLCRSCDLSPCAFRRAPFADELIQSMDTQ